MNFFLKAAVLLLLITASSQAQLPRTGEQPVKSQGEIPELQEWWRAPADWKGVGRNISFLPNFYNGKNAIAIQVSANVGEEPKFHTWLNRFPGDTENVFTWKAGNIKRGDFNGDGITDYIDETGNIYRGVQNGMPPMPEPVKNYGMTGYIADLNSDGYDDVYQPMGQTSNVLFGGPDLQKLVMNSDNQAVELPDRWTEKIYRTPQGEFRLGVYYHKQDVAEGYELYRAVWQKGQMTPQFEKLDSVIKYPDFQQKSFYRGGGGIYQSWHHDNTYFFVIERIDNDFNKNNVVIYDVTNDKFTEHLRFRVDGGINIQMLNQSIDGDEYEDWTFRNNGNRYFLSGGITLDSIVRFKYKGECSGGNMVEPIGDVDGDGINDMVMSTDANSVPNCFRIVKGMAVEPNGIGTNENTSVSFSLSEPQPTPLHSTGSVTATIGKAGRYSLSLYTVDGRNIGQLLETFLEKGTHRLQLNLAAYTLSSGSYILRLSNGSQSVERTIIITN